MPNKTTRPERPRRAGTSPVVRPSSSPGVIRPASSGGSANRPDPKGQRPRKNNTWRTIRENLGWSLVIGLPIILVVLAILWRATNGFQGNPSDQPLPTVAPTATAGTYLAPPAVAGGVKPNRILYFQAPAADKPAQLFSAEADGSNPIQLTNTGELKSTPTWSPDGKQIAFSADGVGIQLVNFDGTGLHTVAYNGFSPVWSPDGKQLAFLRQESATDGRGPDNTGLVRFLYVTNANGKPGDEKQIAYDALGPNWSPDGKSIAYFSLRNAVMFTIPPTGGNPTQINSGGLGGWYPTFTSDGNGFVFYGAKNAAQFVTGLDFGALTPLPTAAAPTATATSTPVPTTAAVTGTAGTPVPTSTIAPTATPAPPAVIGLYRINKDGSGLKQLVEIENPPADNKDTRIDQPRFGTYMSNSADITALFVGHPSFKVAPVVSPDGKQVAGLFAGIGHQYAGITVVPTDGGTPVNIVAGENGLENGTRLGPAFSSDSSKVYYWFQADSNSKKVIRYFDLNTKKETTVVNNDDNSFPVCCGFKK